MTYGANLYDHEVGLGFDGLTDFEGDGPAGGSGGGLTRLDAETAALMMDVAAGLASEAESEAEADAFLPLIAALAPKVLSAVAPLAKSAFARLAPKVANGVLGAGRKMLQNFGQKGMAALPDIARGVARDTVQTVANGGQVSGRAVLRSAAQHTLPFLQDPQRARQAQMQIRRRMAQAQRFRRPPQSSVYGSPWQQPPSYEPQDYGQPGYGGDFGAYGGLDQFPPQMGEPQMPEPHYPAWFS
jgi:hypothetical protein